MLRSHSALWGNTRRHWESGLRTIIGTTTATTIGADVKINFNSAIWSLRRNNHRLGIATETATVKEFQPARAGEITSPDSSQRNTTIRYNCTVSNTRKISAMVGTTRTAHITRKKKRLLHGSHFWPQQSIHLITFPKRLVPCNVDYRTQ